MIIISRISRVYTLPIDVWTTVVFRFFLEMHRKVIQRICVCTCTFSSRQPFRKTLRTSIFCERVALFLLIGAEPWPSCPHTCSLCCTVPSPSHQPNQPPQCCLGDWVGISHSLVVVVPDGVCWWLGLCPTHKCVCRFFSFSFFCISNESH